MYFEKDLVRIAKRDKNKKRNYLIVNVLQAKHVPADPDKTLAMFDELASILHQEYPGERLLLIGFAETATAIGARAAIQLDSYYMQTTREPIKDVEFLHFTESHSHATEQKLIKTDLDKVIPKIDRIVFIEDEVTTGNTILKIIHLIQKAYSEQIRFSVASLINGMEPDAMARYAANHIKIHFLVRTKHSGYSKIAKHIPENGSYFTTLQTAGWPKAGYCQIHAKNYMDGRRLLRGSDYKRACDLLWEQIKNSIPFSANDHILVIGTEEFMYPAIDIAYRLQKSGCHVKCHSTTRSPIAVCSDRNYPLHSRYEFRSSYDDSRKTFIYNMEHYDKVMIITDSWQMPNNGLNDLCNVAAWNGNTNISIVRWCKQLSEMR